LRNILRDIELNQVNFELRRAAVQVAIQQVELASLRLQEPPRPGVVTEGFGATTARDLVSALADLLTVQNAYLSVFVNYEQKRLELDLELGTMLLDDHGLWIDPGSIDDNSFSCQNEGETLKELLAPAEILPATPDGEQSPPASGDPLKSNSEDLPPPPPPALPPRPMAGPKRIVAPQGLVAPKTEGASAPMLKLGPAKEVKQPPLLPPAQPVEQPEQLPEPLRLSPQALQSAKAVPKAGVQLIRADGWKPATP
jgi:hypothetical protein